MISKIVFLFLKSNIQTSNIKLIFAYFRNCSWNYGNYVVFFLKKKIRRLCQPHRIEYHHKTKTTWAALCKCIWIHSSCLAKSESTHHRLLSESTHQILCLFLFSHNKIISHMDFALTVKICNSQIASQEN